jgi:alpha-1,2-glucosyltransferase
MGVWCLVSQGFYAKFLLKLTATGDKSAHTATIHVPQMLYIWPYIALFSAPLVIGPLLRLVTMAVPRQIRARISESFIASGSGRPDILPFVIFTFGGLIAVHFNTIIHPYTLADNRHYVFYVFKILRRYSALKYMAVPVYYSCAWLAVRALASPTIGQHGSRQRREADPTSTTRSQQPCQVSFIVVWLAVTALSVITAPLVEPRYFIIPWIIWRLYVPYHPASLTQDQSGANTAYDMRLVLETFWLLAINAALSYNFLYRTFTWPSEPGSLQRFLW